MNESLRQFVRDRADNRCEYCRLPQTASPFLRFHIEFEVVDGRIVGKTDVGMATAKLLMMNSGDQLRIRRMLINRSEY